MPKEVIFTKSTKFNGELVKAGTKKEVSDAEYKKLLDAGMISNPDSKSQVKVSDNKLIKQNNELESKVQTLESENNELKRIIVLDKMTVKQLNDFADKNKINLDGKTDKEEIVLIIAKSDVSLEEKQEFLG